MPTVSVSMVCESTAANVTAALRESLGGGSSSNGGSNGSCSTPANAATGNAADIAASTGIAPAPLMANGNNGHCADIDNSDCLQNKLVASAKRVLLSKIDYEEVDSYGQSVLDTLKSKYVVLQSNASANTANGSNGSNGNGNCCTSTAENGRSSPAVVATCNNGNNSGNSHNATNIHNGAGGNCAAGYNGKDLYTTSVGPSKNASSSNCSNSSTSVAGSSGNVLARRPSSHELPLPKRVLFPRENVRIGWKNGTRKWQTGVGMMNVGNTCYLNSTLQALFHVSSMANWLASETIHMERCPDGGEAGCIICAMCKTLLMVQTNISSIRPYSIYSKLRMICKHLIMGRQEDAHEFLRYLVEAMEKSYLSRFHNYKELDQYSKETTPLNQILGGYLKSAVRCLSCNHVSVTFQHFQDLLLDIRTADTVEEALDGYFSRERLEDMGYKCESCKKKVSATKQFTLERAPIALCIQLKRFSMMGSKLNKQIAIRPRLDLSKYLSRKNPNEQYTYKLVSMITHLGASQHCGHYTAIGLTESGAYYNFDDSYVRPISVQGVCNTNAYIIFYEMENAPAALSRTVPQSTNPTSSNHLKENNGYQLKTNGFPIGVRHGGNNDDSSSIRIQNQRVIGPQLPPGGLQNFSNQTGAKCNGVKLKNVMSSCSSSAAIAAVTNSSNNNNGNNPKILIHFKNGQPTTVKSSVSSTTTANTVSASSTTLGHDKSNNAATTSAVKSCNNGLPNCRSKFQELPYTKSSTLVTSASKNNVGRCSSPSVKVAIANENSCSSEPEDGVSSTTDGYSECTVVEVEASSLPSMPNLFDDDDKSKQNSSGLHVIFSDNSNSNKSNPNKASLVPYDLESDEDNIWNITAKRQENQSPASDKIERVNNGSGKTIKRSSSFSLLDMGGDINSESLKPKRFGSSRSRSPNIDPSIRTGFPQSKVKQKTDNPIDEIFSHNHKTLKHKSQSPPQLTLPMLESPSSPDKTGYDDCNVHEKYEPNVTPPSTPYGYSTRPPSPPRIQTKTGLWQVTNINTDSTKTNVSTLNQKKSNESSPPPVSLSPPRTWINPFSSKSPDTKQTTLQHSRLNEKRTHVGNGYKSGYSADNSSSSSSNSSAGSPAVSELLQQSHRGYGAPVLTWNGDQPEIEKELKSELREQRQKDFNDDEENEMDRGRQKKVKQHNTKESIYERTPGYNPFQEQDNQRCRLKTNSNSNKNNSASSTSSSNSNNSNRYYGANYRQQPYQRNKAKFHRFNYNKYQRTQQQTAGNSYSSNGNHTTTTTISNSSCNSSSSNNNSYAGRRET